MTSPPSRQYCKLCNSRTMAVLSKQTCPGYDEGTIWQPRGSCPKYKLMPQKITTAEALNIAHWQGIPLSRPTIIKWAKQYHMGRQIGHRGRWLLDTFKFCKILLDEG